MRLGRAGVKPFPSFWSHSKVSWREAQGFPGRQLSAHLIIGSFKSIMKRSANDLISVFLRAAGSRKYLRELHVKGALMWSGTHNVGFPTNSRVSCSLVSDLRCCEPTPLDANVLCKSNLYSKLLFLRTFSGSLILILPRELHCCSKTK